VHEGQISGKKIEPKRPLLDILGYSCHGTAHSYEKKLRQKARQYRLRL